MFIVLRRGEKKGFILERLMKNKFSIEKKSFYECKYYLIDCATDFVPWEAIAQQCNSNVPFIAEKGIVLPCWATSFSDDELLKTLFINKFSQVLDKMNKPSLCVVDYSGRFAPHIYSMLDKASSLRVVTDKTDFYSDFAFEALHNMGASIMISRDIESSFPCEVLFAPSGIRGQCTFPDKMKVYSFYRKGISAENSVCPKGIEIGSEFEDEIPDGINKIRFLCAVYKRLGDKITENIKLDIGTYI